MNRKGPFTKILAIVGAVLVWFPLLAPVLFSLVRLSQSRRFLFDYLMPAELFPAALVGGVLLLWVAWRAHSRRKLISWGLGVAVASLVGGQALAVISGLASGETEPNGWQWALVVASLTIYILALMAIGVGAILLLRDLFNKTQSEVKD
ncbi:MAG: hypothetical protein CVU39_09305 [Chloroflexi bacterium HGW-Chloroflexi-10]|nr:MAG: hypothetical protein CVU39_09305 [Chloroflexi bacterium HGW-Chloroflexi-10]